jgi:Multiubiquitin
MDAPQNDEIDVFAHSQRGEEIPPGKAYRVRIEGEVFRIETPTPTGELLLSKVGKRPCAFELIEEFVGGKNDVVEPNEEVDLRRKGLKGFITAHREIVTIFIDGNPYSIERGDRTVAEILAKVNKTTDGYVLLEEKNGPPLPLPPNKPVKIHGCEVFFTQPQSGASS